MNVLKDFRKDIFLNAIYRIDSVYYQTLFCTIASAIVLHKKKKQPLLKVGCFYGC